MSLEVYPPLPSADLRTHVSEAQDRELAWAVADIVEVCRDIKHGLEDCYALLAPVDPGSTLVMSTPRNEKVKGTVTRVGTRIVKGALNLQLRMLPSQSLNLSPSNPVHIPALDQLHTHLTQALDLLTLTLSPETNNNNSATTHHHDPSSLSSSLRLLADSLSASASLLKGPPPALSDPTWQTSSCGPSHFDPALPANVSFHIGMQDSCIVLWLRVLEQVDAPVHLGLKLGLAIGTVRRLEHDEMDLIFRYSNSADGDGDPRLVPKQAAAAAADARPQPVDADDKDGQDVYVREKVRVESADPNLISLYSKLGFLSHILGQARRNLAAVMGEEIEY